VPSSPAVWIEDEESAGVKVGCEQAAGSCNAACGGEGDVGGNATVVSLNSCFQFIGIGDFVTLMCQCEDGSYPSEIVGFSTMTAIDEDTGRIPGAVNGALKVGRGLELLLLLALCLF
jgi:hypothetical protein